MLKATKLRQTIEAHLPYYVQNPDRLSVFIEKGKIHGVGGGGLSFDYEYTATVVLSSFAESIDVLAVPIFDFMCTHQPDIMRNHDAAAHAISFEAEIINSDTVDLAITVRLRESVAVTKNPDGSHTATHLDAIVDVDAQAMDWLMFGGTAHINGEPTPAHNLTAPNPPQVGL